VLVDLPSHALVALLWVAMPSLALSDFGVSFICLPGYHDQKELTGDRAALCSAQPVPFG